MGVSKLCSAAWRNLRVPRHVGRVPTEAMLLIPGMRADNDDPQLWYDYWHDLYIYIILQDLVCCIVVHYQSLCQCVIACHASVLAVGIASHSTHSAAPPYSASPPTQVVSTL